MPVLPRLNQAVLLARSLALSIHRIDTPLLAQPPRAPASLTDGVAVRPIDPNGVSLPDAEASRSDRQFAFIAYGDSRGPADGQIVQPQHSEVIDTILRVIGEQRRSGVPVRFVVQSGDAVSNGRFGQQWNVGYIPLIERLLYHGRVPYLFAVGNHDVTSSPNVEDEGRRLGLANTSAAMSKLWPPEGSPDRLAGYPTYTFRYGQFFFVVLDSNIASDMAQLEWVSAQLRAVDRARYPHIVAVFHHPPLTSGQHGGDTVEPQASAIRQFYMPLFRQHHVRLLLAGHDHLYDHYVERYEDAGGSHRIDHLVTGGGGAPIYRYSGEQDLERYAQAALPLAVRVEHAVRPSADEAGNPHHVVVIEVHGDRLRLRVVPTVAAPFRPYSTDTIWLE